MNEHCYWPFVERCSKKWPTNAVSCVGWLLPNSRNFRQITECVPPSRHLLLNCSGAPWATTTKNVKKSPSEKGWTFRESKCYMDPKWHFWFSKCSSFFTRRFLYIFGCCGPWCTVAGKTAKKGVKRKVSIGHSFCKEYEKRSILFCEKQYFWKERLLLFFLKK